MRGVDDDRASGLRPNAGDAVGDDDRSRHRWGLARGDGGLASCQHQWGATMETARLEPRPPSFMAVRRIVVSKIGTQDNADCREIERPPSIVLYQVSLIRTDGPNRASRWT